MLSSEILLFLKTNSSMLTGIDLALTAYQTGMYTNAPFDKQYVSLLGAIN